MTEEPVRPTVAVVSVSYGSEAELEAMLGSLPAAASRPLLVVVADNLPEVGRTREVVAAAGGSYVPMRSNLGYGGAINEVVRGLPSEIEWVMITNPDVVFHPGSIDRMLAAQHDIEVGVSQLVRHVVEPLGSRDQAGTVRRYEHFDEAQEICLDPALEERGQFGLAAGVADERLKFFHR